jgi:hypothetical protein
MGDVTAVLAMVVIFLEFTITGSGLHLRGELNKLTEERES